jgi:hypothetical protein
MVETEVFNRNTSQGPDDPYSEIDIAAFSLSNSSRITDHLIAPLQHRQRCRLATSLAVIGRDFDPAYRFCAQVGSSPIKLSK